MADTDNKCTATVTVEYNKDKKNVASVTITNEEEFLNCVTGKAKSVSAAQAPGDTGKKEVAQDVTEETKKSLSGTSLKDFTRKDKQGGKRRRKSRRRGKRGGRKSKRRTGKKARKSKKSKRRSGKKSKSRRRRK